MVLPEQMRARFLRVGSWIRHHSVEIVLAALFGLPFAYFAGAYLEHPDPYTIYVVADHDTNEETLNIFRSKARGYLQKIGDVYVRVQPEILGDNTQETAEKMAADLSSRPDTLMVIGSGRSQMTEKSLPIYFKASPRVPYLATTASDDDLLKDCTAECYEWNAIPLLPQKVSFAPLLQLSPTNKIQASSAIEFAIENGKSRFIIVEGNDSQNKSYEDDLVKEYEGAIQDAKKDGALELNKYEIDRLPDEKVLGNMKPTPDCVLYVGNLGEAQALVSQLSHMKTLDDHTLLILSDSVIQTSPSDVQLAEGFKPEPNSKVLPLRFTHQTFASDYNRHVSTYDRDAFAIAKTLIQDLNDRGVDFRMRAKSLLHIHRVGDARRNLDRVMKENAAVRTWYAGEAETGEHPLTYIFKGHNQYNGIFHVWRLTGTDTEPGPGMEDVDHWHPGRGITSAQESAALAVRY